MNYPNSKFLNLAKSEPKSNRAVREESMKQETHIPSGPRPDRFLESLRMERPCFTTLSERRTLSFLTRQRNSQAPPPPLSTWLSSLLSCASSVSVTISGGPRFPKIQSRTYPFLSRGLRCCGVPAALWVIGNFVVLILSFLSGLPCSPATLCSAPGLSTPPRL